MSGHSVPALLAKSCGVPGKICGEETLRGHTAMVLAAARKILAARAESALGAAGLSTSLAARLSRVVLCGAFIHDLGKCSDHFQAMVRGQRSEPQLVRHEALSLLLCWPGKALASWLRGAVDSDEDYILALLAAAGHHRKFFANALAPIGSGAGSSISLLVSHADFAQTLVLGATELALPPIPSLSEDLTWTIHRRRWQPEAEFQEMRAEAESVIRPGTLSANLLPLAKALLLDADVAGSALPRSGERLSWIEGSLGSKSRPEELAQIVTKRLAGNAPRPFQIEVAQSQSPMTLVLAGCGTGKTLAAYLWAAQQHAGRQVFMTYPTTGTATEGFRDYLHGVDSIEAELIHGRAEVDLEIFSLREEGGASRSLDRLEALRHWGRDVITCTVDTVLGLIQNQRRGLYAFAGLCHGAVIFDEIHAYDEQLFGCLLRFLEGMPGLPVLLMTASLPNARLEALHKLTERVHKRPLTILRGPLDLETLPRYRLSAQTEPWPMVEQCLQENGKVLWVCNTVDRTIATAEHGKHLCPLLYHSRFRYEDRVHRHADVITAFQNRGSAFAVTTQVCEMSLDLSADLLVTDLAPIPSMVQRLGRLNRRSTPENPSPVRPFVVIPFQGLPYTEGELALARLWMARLADRDLNQKDLAQAWTELETTTAPSRRTPSTWLDGIFDTSVDSAREASPSVTVLLRDDADRVSRGEVSAIRHALPMNPPPGALRDSWQRWPQVKGYVVPPRSAIDYDPIRGARWVR